MKRIWFYLLLVGVFTGFMFSCSPKKTEKKEIVIAIIPKIDNFVFDEVKESALKAGKELGVTITWEAPTSIDGVKQKELIDNLIHYGVDGILISCNDAEMLKEPINRAIKAGIKVATFDSDCNKSDRIFYVGTDNKKAGTVCAETMLSMYQKAKKQPDQIVVLSGGVTAPNMAERLIGFRSVINEKNIAEVLYSFEMSDYAKDQLSFSLKSNQHINGVQMIWGAMALNGIDSVPALQRFIDKGGITVFFDVSKPLLKYIQDKPNCATMKQDFKAMGYDGVKNLYDAIQGNSYKMQILYDVQVIDQSNVKAELDKM